MVEASGARIRTSVRGAGPPVLLIMGLGGNLEMWDPFERLLNRDGFSTITFDAPGTGGSTAWRLPRRFPALARCTEQVLDALGCDTVDALGVSFGGAMAQQLARQAPNRIRRLVLAATMPGLGGLPGNPRALLALASPRRYRDPEYLGKVAGTLYGGRARVDPITLMTQSSARFDRPPSRFGYLSQLYAIQGWSSLPWLHRLSQPTLVMAGDDDPIVPLVNAKILARRIPDARLHVVRGGGHLFLLDSAPAAAPVVADFLR